MTLQEKFTHENCTLPTIHLGPAGRRPAWPSDDNDDDDGGGDGGGDDGGDDGGDNGGDDCDDNRGSYDDGDDTQVNPQNSLYPSLKI